MGDNKAFTVTYVKFGIAITYLVTETGLDAVCPVHLPGREREGIARVFPPTLWITCVYVCVFVCCQIKKGPSKGQFVEVVKRKIPIDKVSGVSNLVLVLISFEIFISSLFYICLFWGPAVHTRMTS